MVLAEKESELVVKNGKKNNIVYVQFLNQL